MKFDRNKLLTSVSAVALVLAVGACSSSGDDDGITAERDDALIAQKAAEAKVAALTGELATANTDLGAANGEVTRLTDELGTATASLGTANGGRCPGRC